MIVPGSTSPLLMTPSGYNLTRSLRFRSSASAYLSRTPASTTNRQKWTWSGWAKRGLLGSTNKNLFCATDNTTASTFFGFGAYSTSPSDSLFFYTDAGAILLYTSAVFRDPSAWYHIVVSVDTTQATAANRVIIYVNNVQYSLTGTQPSQNANLQVNSTSYLHTIGSYYTASNYLDGYLTEVNFIDGQALTPSSFGQTSTTTGVWQPKKYTGTYGTNGFYLPFTDNSALTSGSNAGLGKDFSGNGNYWNTNNISITSGATYDSMTDVPTLTSATAANYCVWNPLEYRAARGLATFSNANLQATTNNGVGTQFCFGTMGVSSGKWYWECTASVAAQTGVGIDNGGVQWDNFSNNYYYYTDGTFNNAGTSGAYGASFTNGDIIGVALDMDGGTLAFYKNGVSQGTAKTGLSGTFVPCNPLGTVSGSMIANFGQRPFTYTPPSGYVALNTFNLPTPTIGATSSTLAGNYFNPVLYTGTGSSQAVTGVGFQPDFVWLKSRSNTWSHELFDAVRGVNKYLKSNAADAETSSTSLTSFDSNGFTVTGGGGQNNSGDTFVAWNWKANGAGSSNTNGSITSTVSVNTSSGFSIVTYTGTGAAATIGHGLGAVPKMIIVKDRNNTYDWQVYHVSLGNTQFLNLNKTNAVASALMWNNTTPTSSVFSVGNVVWTNNSGDPFVAYCFAEIAGFSKFGSYTGNGSADGPFCYTGFQPRYIMVKPTSTTGDWTLIDTARNPYNVSANLLWANLSSAEASFATADILSNGFKLRTTGGENTNAASYIFMAFASNPFKYSLGH